MYPLAIIEARARQWSGFLLELTDSGVALVLTLRQLEGYSARLDLLA